LLRWGKWPTWAGASVAAIAPVIIFYFFGEDALLPFIAFTGIILAFVISRLHFIPQLFAVFIATYFFSVEMSIAGGAALAIPAEPLAMLLAAASVFHLLQHIKDFWGYKEQPLFWLVALWCLSLIVSTALSSMWQVSAKYTFMQLVYVAVGALAVPIVLQQSIERLKSAAWWFVLPALFFGVFSVINLLPYQFNPGAAANIAQPFFSDHTVFSAAVSLILPLLFLQHKINLARYNFLFFILGFLLLFSVYISSSRGAWAGLIVAFLFFFFIQVKGKLWHLAGIAVVLLALAFFNQETIERKIFTNQHISRAAESNLQQQALSAANITSDVSNLERLNRWKCAWRMGLEKPLFGYGPGTYQFQYLPWQRDEDMTYISVTSPYNTVQGRGGSAHSEYFLALSENGFTGLILYVALQLAMLFAFYGVWYGRLTSAEKYFALAVYLGLLTYTIHGLFNNFLNQAQMGLTWWMMVGALLFVSTKNKNIETAA
jgi:O-antigen ligase